MLFKIVLLGEVSVGKTTLRRSYMGKVLTKSYIKTIGFDFAIKNHNDGTVHIWDLAGESTSNTIKAFMRGSSGVIQIFDAMNVKTLEKSKNWIDQVFNELGTNVPIAFVCNKIDLRDDINDIEKKKIEQVLDEIRQGISGDNIKYFETSALKSEGVDNIFDWIIPYMAEKVNE